MRVAALILGIIGGLAGIFGGGLTFTIGGLGQVFDMEDAAMVTNLGLAAVPAGALGIIGGALALSKPKLAGILMLVSAIAGLIFVSALYSVAFVLLIVGAILAFLGHRSLMREAKSSKSS